MLATAPSGSGKTGAYLLPLLAALMRRTRQGQAVRNTAYPTALVLVPTHELVQQVRSALGGKWEKSAGSGCSGHHARAG